MISDRELPGLTDGLLRAGCVWVDYLDSHPSPDHNGPDAAPGR